MKFQFSQQVFKKYSNIKFYDNLSIGSQVVLCRQTHIIKLIVAFHNFANACNRFLEWFSKYKSGVTSLKMPNTSDLN